MSVKEYMEGCKRQVDEYLSNLFLPHSDFQTLISAINYSLLADGKRLRPSLCLAVAEAFDVEHATAMPAAAALELIHCYSLIHDDLPCMDDDDLRRGQLTNHKVFGEAIALLAGDTLLTAAFEQLSRPIPGILPHQQLLMIQVLAKNSGLFGMVGGQASDLAAEGQSGSLGELEFIHIHKTAKLIQAAVLLGGILANVNERKLHALETYGLKLGLAFQIIDDYLDVVGDTAQLGKTVGADASLEKLTYPRLIGIEETAKLAQKTIGEAIEALQMADIQAPNLTSLAHFVVDRTS